MADRDDLSHYMEATSRMRERAEGAEARAKFFSDQSKRYYAALATIADFEGDADGAALIAREALVHSGGAESA